MGWTDFGNSFLDDIGIGGIKNAIDGGSGGFSGSTNNIFNKAGSTVRGVFDTGVNIVHKGEDTAIHLAANVEHTAENVGDAGQNMSKFLKSLSNIDPKTILIGGVALIVILKI